MKEERVEANLANSRASDTRHIALEGYESSDECCETKRILAMLS
jgi:hypothetical protein